MLGNYETHVNANYEARIRKDSHARNFVTSIWHFGHTRFDARDVTKQFNLECCVALECVVKITNCMATKQARMEGVHQKAHEF